MAASSNIRSYDIASSRCYRLIDLNTYTTIRNFQKVILLSGEVYWYDTDSLTSQTPSNIAPSVGVNEELRPCEEQGTYGGVTRNVIYGYFENLNPGDSVDLKAALDNYLTSTLGSITPDLGNALKISISSNTDDVTTYMHIGDINVNDNNTKYWFKQYYEFHKGNIPYRLSQIYIRNNSTSTSRLNFTFEIEY